MDVGAFFQCHVFHPLHLSHAERRFTVSIARVGDFSVGVLVFGEENHLKIAKVLPTWKKHTKKNNHHV